MERLLETLRDVVTPEEGTRTGASGDKDEGRMTAQSPPARPRPNNTLRVELLEKHSFRRLLRVYSGSSAHIIEFRDRSHALAHDVVTVDRKKVETVSSGRSTRLHEFELVDGSSRVTAEILWKQTFFGYGSTLRLAVAGEIVYNEGLLKRGA